MRSLIDIKDLTLEEIDSLIETAEDIMKNPAKYDNLIQEILIKNFFRAELSVNSN